MKPAPFEYLAVNSVSEAVTALQRYGPNSRIIAGGQSLMQEMNLRQTRPAFLVDINGIKELDYIRETANGLAIGALTRHRTVERSELVQKICPLLQEAVKHIAHFQIRNRGTIGGSLSHNAPGAEYGVVTRLLDAEIVAVGPDGERIIPAEKFFIGHFKTDLKPAEMVTEVRFPALSKETGYAFLEVTRRHGHIPIVSTAATLRLNPDDTVKEAHIALGNVSSKGVPYKVKAVSRLYGQKLTQDVLADLAKAIEAEVDPDPHADSEAVFVKQFSGITSRRVSELSSATYRKQVSSALSCRALNIAFQRIKGGI
ncbi:FAD binding domain-containing protein [Thermoflavimicrobium dichotomicum]|uniref:Carbon-monoxide dehydrogenase medium subunit n=1 Tax=Thermoflavimicrobium dichotomicum TaxID=46223 RepID=A0A1I3Q8N0_9BACL|nr:xanthine dehydrogenase family protein subunit M [Thermoflavimicrobium dichotomicum]SFJ30040.1 carbon-monoxide dehydrogenase medium subunit [Thermoflavimicrobium dichotomicum]